MQDSKQVVESYKSGFEPPGDVDFEDYGQAMKRTASETSLSNSGRDSREKGEKPGGRSKGKLWPFIKNKNKVRDADAADTRGHPHPKPTPPPHTHTHSERSKNSDRVRSPVEC